MPDVEMEGKDEGTCHAFSVHVADKRKGIGDSLTCIRGRDIMSWGFHPPEWLEAGSLPDDCVSYQLQSL